MGDEHRPGGRDAAQAQLPRLQRHVEPGRPRSPTRAPTRAGYDLNRDLTIALAARGAADPRPDRRAPADHHARPARLRQPDAAAPEHAAAQRQQRVRPLHQARPAERAQHRDRASPPSATRRSPARGSRSATTRRACGTTSRRSTCRRSRCCRAASRTRSRRRCSPAAPAPTAIRRADIDTDVHEVAIKTSLKYIQDHRNQVIFDQAEGYRRGWAGEPLRDIPVGYVAGLGPGGQVRHDVPARVRDPRRHAPALRARPPSASSTC